MPSAGIRIQKRKKQAAGHRREAKFTSPPSAPSRSSFVWLVGRSVGRFRPNPLIGLSLRHCARTSAVFARASSMHARDARLTNRFGSSRLFRISNSSYPYLSHPFRWRKKKNQTCEPHAPGPGRPALSLSSDPLLLVDTVSFHASPAGTRRFPSSHPAGEMHAPVFLLFIIVSFFRYKKFRQGTPQDCGFCGSPLCNSTTNHIYTPTPSIPVIFFRVREK